MVEEQICKRKLTDGIYYTVNYNWIKREIVKMYTNITIEEDKNFISNMQRELIINKSFSDNDDITVGYYFFALRGSPPKGCAVYSPGHKLLNIISPCGRVKKFDNIFIEEL